MMHNLALTQATSPDEIAVTSPFDGTLVGTVVETCAASVNLLLERARRGAQIARSLPRHKRSAILEKAAAAIEASCEDFALLIVNEAGKTITQARKETTRCVNTLKLSADEAKRNIGEVIPFDAYAGSETRQGWYTENRWALLLPSRPIMIPSISSPTNLVRQLPAVMRYF